MRKSKRGVEGHIFLPVLANGEYYQTSKLPQIRYPFRDVDLLRKVRKPNINSKSIRLHIVS